MRVEDNWGTFVSLSKWNVSWSSDTGVLDNTCLCLQLCPAVPWELSPSRVLIWCSQALDTAAPGLRQSRHPLTKGSGRIVPDRTAARCVWDLYLQLHGGKSEAISLQGCAPPGLEVGSGHCCTPTDPAVLVAWAGWWQLLTSKVPLEDAIYHLSPVSPFCTAS